MVVPFLRGSRVFRALVLTTTVFSFLLWLYIVARIVFNQVDMGKPFVYDFPFFSFWVLGAIAFAVSFLCTLLHLWLWGRFGLSSMDSQSYVEREP